jgi:hypothetical protein
MTSEELVDILGLTIKQDNCEKLISFLAMLSTYSGDPINLAFHSSSSSGKSYIATETAKLFPVLDVKKIGYCSPTAFFHEASTFDEIRKLSVVDLERKILIFLDQPHHQVSERLRPLLSHDDKEIAVKITDRGKRGENRTKNVILRGFSAVVFASANLKLDEQEATRFLLLSPGTGQDKIREAVQERIKSSADSLSYKIDVETEPRRISLIKRIEAIKAAAIQEVNLDAPELVEEMFLSKRKILKPRHTRDMAHIISLIKAFALLNYWNRGYTGGIITANDRDIKEAFKLWDRVGEAQELGVPPAVLEVFNRVIVRAYREKNPNRDFLPQGLTRKDITQEFYDAFDRPLSDHVLRREILPMLDNAGLIIQEADKDDRRKILVFPVERGKT